jgi:bacterioferritin (cytochrome b1)
MDIFIALLAGSTAKLYDDLVDNKLITNEYHIKMLETLQCFLLGGLSINNFTFSIIASTITICNYIGGKGQYSNPYEFSLIAMYPIFVILSYSKREYLNLYDWLLFLFLCVVLALEPILIKEDSNITSSNSESKPTSEFEKLKKEQKIKQETIDAKMEEINKLTKENNITEPETIDTKIKNILKKDLIMDTDLETSLNYSQEDNDQKYLQIFSNTVAPVQLNNNNNNNKNTNKKYFNNYLQF